MLLLLQITKICCANSNCLARSIKELKLKFESINDTNDSLEMKQAIPCAIPISMVDASTSCIDLIDESCSNPCNENVVVESCDDFIAKENDELKQEVERLMKDLVRLKGKSIVQPSQDIREDMVTVQLYFMCYIYHFLYFSLNYQTQL